MYIHFMHGIWSPPARCLPHPWATTNPQSAQERFILFGFLGTSPTARHLRPGKSDLFGTPLLGHRLIHVLLEIIMEVSKGLFSEYQAGGELHFPVNVKTQSNSDIFQLEKHPTVKSFKFAVVRGSYLASQALLVEGSSRSLEPELQVKEGPQGMPHRAANPMFLHFATCSPRCCLECRHQFLHAGLHPKNPWTRLLHRGPDPQNLFPCEGPDSKGKHI